MTCQHFPKDIFDQCPICFPKADYEIMSQVWGGEPIIEVFRDGEAWATPWDSHFRFGRVKTAMILYCIDKIEQFALAENPSEMIPFPIVHKADPDLVIQLQTFPAFTNSYGIYVEEPFLRLDRVVNDTLTLHIGFGQPKAVALVLLRSNLEKWLKSVHGWYR